jgi:hypothetical protein
VSIPVVGKKDRKPDKMKVKLMPNVYAILGESDARKSSTVRALTGVPQQYDAWSVATSLTGNIDVYVEIRALQESNIQPQDFVSKIANVHQYRINRGESPINNILIPLRILAFNGCPDGTDYLQHFASAGWNVSQIVVLGNTPLTITLPTAVPAHLITGSASMPANAIASNIRGWWNWL